MAVSALYLKMVGLVQKWANHVDWLESVSQSIQSVLVLIASQGVTIC